MVIHIKEVDDWVCVYKDGWNVYANHSCSLRDGLEALGIDFVYEYKDVSSTNGDFNELETWLETPPS